MYELFKIISVIAIILWALRDKIDEPRNVKYCCNKVNETEDDLSTFESLLIEVPSDAPSDDDMPAARPFVADETPVIDMPAAESIVEISTVDLSTIDMPAAESTIDMPAAESTIDMPAAESIDDESTIDNEPEEEIVSIEDLYGDYTDLLMPSIMLRLSNNTSINNTFVSRTPRNNCFGVVHASI
jgi:hypothetical protein